jgi:succinate dehydrogenase / fumarate reductase membrane anchor subunit
MANVKHGLRSPLGRARGLGAAGHGTEHWLTLRLTSLALVPLSLYFMYGFFEAVVFGNGYTSALLWVKHPVNAGMLLLFLGVGYHHTANGLQTVIEDYVHQEGIKFVSLLLTKAMFWLLAVASILAVLKIMLGA